MINIFTLSFYSFDYNLNNNHRHTSSNSFTFFCTILHRDAAFVERTLGHGDAEALEVLDGVWSSLEDTTTGGQRPASWEDCVAWARCKWETLYNNDICQLLHCLSPDKVKIHRRGNQLGVIQLSSGPLLTYCFHTTMWRKGAFHYEVGFSEFMDDYVIKTPH